jgi:tryptophan-rich sensory protein
MAAAAWLVWRKGGWREARVALSLYVVQLAANALWTWLFFAWHQGTGALLEILLLCALVFATLVAFWRVRRVAGALLVPYAGWVTFAAVLTYTVWRANPAQLP